MSTPARKRRVQVRSKKTELQRAYVPVTAVAKVVEFEDDMTHVTFTDGRVLSVPLVWFSALRKATAEQRTGYEIGGGTHQLALAGARGDLSVGALMAGVDWRST